MVDEENASHCIIDFLHKEAPISDSDLIEFLPNCIEKHGVLFALPHQIQSEQGALWCSDQYTRFLDLHNIFQSLAGNLDKKFFEETSFNELFWSQIGRSSTPSLHSQESFLWDGLTIAQRNELIKHIIKLYNGTHARVQPIRSLRNSEINQVELLQCETASKLNRLAEVSSDKELSSLIEEFHIYTVLSHEGNYINALIDSVINPDSLAAIRLLSNDKNAISYVADFANHIQNQTMQMSRLIYKGFKQIVNELALQRELNHQQKEDALTREIAEIKSHTSVLYSVEEDKKAKR